MDDLYLRKEKKDMWLLNVVGGTALSLFIIVVGVRGLRIIFKLAKTGLDKLDEWITDKAKG